MGEEAFSLTQIRPFAVRMQEYRTYQIVIEEIFKEALSTGNNSILQSRQLFGCTNSPWWHIVSFFPWWALGYITTNKASGDDGIPVELFQILKDKAVKVLRSICQQIWKTQQWPQDWKRLVFIPIPKKGNAKERSNYCTIVLISHTSKVMLKILHWDSPGQNTGMGSLSLLQRIFPSQGLNADLPHCRWIINKRDMDLEEIWNKLGWP